MITIYSNECLNCGKHSMDKQRVLKWANSYDILVDIKRTKYDQSAREECMRLLDSAGMPTNNYHPIVHFGGNNIILLSEATIERLDSMRSIMEV